MMTKEPANRRWDKLRKYNFYRVLRIVLFFVAAITAGSVLNITIAPVISDDHSVHIDKSGGSNAPVLPPANTVNDTITTTTQHNTVYINDTVTYASATSHLCGHLTKKNTPCRHWVKGPGYCWQHR